MSDILSARGASSRFKSSFGVFTFWLKIDPASVAKMAWGLEIAFKALPVPDYR
jgi:hypothetical protein